MNDMDPNGKDQHESGAKLDAGKNRLALVMSGFSAALYGVGKVGTYGAEKYTDNGWKSVPDGLERYQDAMLRHLTAYWGGQTFDPESGIHHLYHMAWNALAVAQLAGNEPLREDQKKVLRALYQSEGDSKLPPDPSM